MATSMAAALAASIPAPQPVAAPAPAPIEIPASMAKVIDIEAVIPIKTVQLDGLVVSKIMRHGRETAPASATGLLLGIDLDGTLEVSNCFALPTAFATDDDDKSTSRFNSARYQATMLRSLKEVQSDDSVVGFYQSTSMGAFFQQSLIDTQMAHHDKLRHGGIVIVHDTTQAARANATFRAFRLRPEFVDAHKTGKFNTQSLITHGLTFSRIFDEIPVTVKNSCLLDAFLKTMTASKPPASLKTSTSALPPSYAVLDLETPQVLNRNLESMIEALETYKNEESNTAYALRQIAREKAKQDAYVVKRKEENAMRVAQGMAPLPEEDASRLFRVPQEPSRLEGMLLLGQIDGQAKTLDIAANAGLVKMYAARASSSLV